MLADVSFTDSELDAMLDRVNANIRGMRPRAIEADKQDQADPPQIGLQLTQRCALKGWAHHAR